MSSSHALVLQDQPLLLDLITQSLGDSGFTVDGVTTPEEAATALATQRHDLLVVDGRVRGLDLIGCLLELRSSSPGVPFVVLTGLGTRLAALPHTLAPCATIALPLDREAFTAAITRCLNEADALAGASVAFGFDLETRDATEATARVVAHVRSLNTLAGGLPAGSMNAFLHTLRSAMRAASQRGTVRVRCSFGTSVLSCEVGMSEGGAAWSVDDSGYALVRDSLAKLECSPDGRRLSFAVTREARQAA